MSDYLITIEPLLEAAIVLILGVITKFIITFLDAKKEEALAKTDSETKKKYIEMLNDTITDCVNATQQTYVDALKRDNSFTAKEQKKALEDTYKNVLTILGNDATEYLKEGCGDLEVYIKNKIEAKVKESK